jgi:hypothetical protein
MVGDESAQRVYRNHRRRNPAITDDVSWLVAAHFHGKAIKSIGVIESIRTRGETVTRVNSGSMSPACRNETAFAPLPAGFDLDTLLAAKYNRKTDNCGCFSFHTYTFQVDSLRPPVKRHIVFLFSEKIGFKAYYDKKYYGVKFLDFLNKGKKSYLPQVT